VRRGGLWAKHMGLKEVLRGGLWAKHMGLKEVLRGGLWAKHMGLKEVLREHPWGTHWELKEHIGNKGKMKKNPPLTPTQNLNEKKSRHLECMLQPTHWLHVEDH